MPKKPTFEDRLCALEDRAKEEDRAKAEAKQLLAETPELAESPFAAAMRRWFGERK